VRHLIAPALRQIGDDWRPGASPSRKNTARRDLRAADLRPCRQPAADPWSRVVTTRPGERHALPRVMAAVCLRGIAGWCITWQPEPARG